MLTEIKNALRRYRIIRFIYFYKRQIPLTKFRILAKLQEKEIVHFFHIGKTGGTSIKHALNCTRTPFINDKYIVFCHPHWFHLKDTLKGEKIFFFVRDPIDRFVSGFYSRKRKGAPRLYQEWTPDEKEAFADFDSPNHLALALSESDDAVRRKAVKAMKSIEHVKTSYWDWFDNSHYFSNRIDDVLFVGTQKNLDTDFSRLKRVLQLPDELQLPSDQVNMHKNPEHVDKHLDKRAIENLKDWFSGEYKFLKLLEGNNLL